MEMTQPRYVVTDNGKANYLQPDGTWGPYRTAKRFKAEAADKACEETPGAVGVFPCSVPKPIRR
jgi:hypothetical protein